MTVKSDWNKEFEEFKKDLEKKLNIIQKEADKKGNKDFKKDLRREYELNKKLAERTTAEIYDNNGEIEKEYRSYRITFVLIQIVIGIVALNNWLGYEDISHKIIFSIIASIFIIITFIGSGAITDAQHNKERAFELDVRWHEDKKLFRDLEKLERYEMNKDPDGWKQFLKETKELNKTLELVKGWRMEEERLEELVEYRLRRD